MALVIFLELIIFTASFKKKRWLAYWSSKWFLFYAFKLLEDLELMIAKKNNSFCSNFRLCQENFRNDIYKDYKANRSEAPEDLAPQFEYKKIR